MSNLPSIPPQDPGFHMGPPVEINPAAPPPKFRLKKFIFFLRKFWWIPLITLILGAAGAVADFMYTPPQFVSDASMWRTATLRLPEGAAFEEDQNTYFGTMEGVFQSENLREHALTVLAASGTNTIIKDNNGNPIPVSISLEQRPGSAVYQIEATSINPAFTPVYLNALVNCYLNFKKDTRTDIAGETLASIATQIDSLEQEIKDAQQALAQFEQSNNLIVIQQESEVAGGYLAKLKTQLADYQLESNLLDAVALEKGTVLIRQTTNFANPLFEQVGVNGAGSSPVADSQSAAQNIASLQLERNRLSRYLRPEHPKIVKLDQEIEDATNLLSFYNKQNEQNITTARQALKLRMEGVQQSIKDWEARVNDDSARIAQADSRKASINQKQSMYDRLSSLLDNVDITRNIDQDPLAILQPASPATRSYAKLKSNLSTASFGGLAAGLAIVLLLAMRDDRFASVVEVTERIGDTVVGQVPEMPQLRHASATTALMGNGDDQHMYVESYRNLRSALLYLAVDGVRPKVLLITSAVPNEGKSTIASNLACAMALGGARILLIDGDLRKGRLHDILQLQSKPGLADLLSGPAELDKFIQASHMPNLSFMACGYRPQNPGDLFLGEALNVLLAKLREQFDYVIIDSSPVFAADDTTTLAPKVDGTLFVVRSRFSRSGIVKEALDLLYQRQATVLGLILNRTNPTNRSYHYYKYSEYKTSAET